MHLRGRQQLLVTERRFFNAEGYAYFHKITWAPHAATRLILQRIVRTTKLRNESSVFGSHVLHGARGDYWELWEVFGGHVYPFNTQAGHAPYVPNGRATAPFALAFHVPATVALAAQPFITAAPPNPGGVPATAANFAAARHDIFTVGVLNGRRGTFKIYAEVYELDVAKCVEQRAWLNQFLVQENGDGTNTAGNLPAKFGTDLHLPLAEPTLLRYEAGEFDYRPRQPQFARDRPFPSKGTNVRFRVAGATVVNR